MQKYICKNCNDLQCDTSVCPVCGNRTELLKTQIFWCTNCNVPSYSHVCDSCHSLCKEIGTDIRPVFPEERLLIELCLKKPMAFAGKSVWKTNTFYIVDGEKIKVSYSDIIANTKAEDIILKMQEYKLANSEYCDSFFDSEIIKKFIEINKSHLNLITAEATNYICDVSKNYDVGDMFVSFSGGKDSTVTSHLVLTALGNRKIIHIYGDTTLEYPTSELYIYRFRKQFPETPMLVAKNKDQNFNDLCEVVGPPSRVMRWCCTVFKTGAITRKIETTFKNKTSLLTFYGIRRNESNSRSKYDRESNSPKIAKQRVVSPIIDWSEFDIWLYIISNGIDFNDAYKQGFSRVGCWCCPNNSAWSEFLSSIYMPEQYKKFRETLYKFAKSVGKPDWKEYIETGKWKARQGGNGLEFSKNAVVSFKPCALEENALNFELMRPYTNDFLTLFIPFGIINHELGNKRLGEVFILDRKTSKPIIKITGITGRKNIKISLISTTRLIPNFKVFESMIKSQITKYQTCIGCSACQSVCRFDALKVINLQPGSVSQSSIRYTIDEKKCVGCLECVTHFDGGCYIKKVLRTKKEG